MTTTTKPDPAVLARPAEPAELAYLLPSSYTKSRAEAQAELLNEEEAKTLGEDARRHSAVPSPAGGRRFVIRVESPEGDFLGYW